MGYFDKTAMSIIAVPVSREFGFNPTEMGMVLSAFFLGFAVVTPLGGYLADRYGARRVLLVVMLLWSAFTGVTALAWSLVSLIVLRGIFGAAEGSFPPASSVAVAELMPVRQRGRAKSLLMSGATLGTAFGAYLVASLTETWGWRGAFWLFCGIGLLLSGVFLVVSRPMSGPGAGRSGSAERIPVLRVLRTPLVGKLAVMQFGVGIFTWGMSQWMPTYWVQVKGLKLTSAGLATAIPSLVAFVAMIGVGFAADRFSRKEGRVVAGLMSVAIVFVLLTYFASSVVAGVVFLSVAQVAAAACAPLLSIVILKRMRRSVTGTATGITNFGQQFAGVIAPTAMGALIQATGGSYLAVFVLVMAVMAVAALIALTADRVELGELAQDRDAAAG
ncbi:major facilitator transporter [Amycolatopsis mediterranei S699]|uniref:Major facilitator transporter n=1 Tax=Amycolatopsis mediterranei (strain S699) TaxID=713604 RepID=A0A9R0P481_AMYMS|nr:major facilitator transporter [Amycolatopsis mediterranei S699]